MKRWMRGEFCWYELGTKDVDAARRFYTTLFGWGTKDVPMGPMGIYTLFQHQGQDLGGMYKLEGATFEGVPPHWMTYVAVDDVDADAARATSFGGKVVDGPMDVPNVGRMAVIQDPLGATISMFEAGNHPGTGRFDGAPSTFCWSELATTDMRAARQFYTRLFGWGAKVSDLGPMKYTEWQVDGNSIGGMMEIRPEMGPMPPCWMSYLATADCDATAAKATQLGAKICVAPRDIPHVGRFAVLADPQGAVLALFTFGQA